MKGENVQLEKTIVPNFINNTYIDLSIDKYFNIARFYVELQTTGVNQWIICMQRAILTTWHIHSCVYLSWV